MNGIISFLKAIIDLVVNSLTSLFHLVMLIPSFLTFGINSLNYLPDVLISFAVFSILIFVIFFFIGRSAE